jgi:3-oxoacyl-[acyl-carrier protein] reductase
MIKKNIIITGASHGLGYDLAIDLSQDNCRLFLTARSYPELQKLKKNCKYSYNHRIYSADLTDLNNCAGIIKEANIFFKKKIDAIIHVAGGGLGLKSFDLEYKDILKVMNLNFFSSVELNRLLLPQMIRKKKGNIIHIGSIASYEAVGSLAYNISKASLNAYVKTAAREMSKYNVVISGIAPGGFISKNNAMHRLKKKNLVAYNRFINERLPRKKMGSTKEIIPLIKFLCTDKAGLMSGSLIQMDGGESKSYNL